MKTIDDINFSGRKALIRVDYNVPLNAAFEITDTTRIDATLATVGKILGDGGAVILMSHLGRPKAGPEDKFSLRHLLPYLDKVFQTKVQFAADCIGEDAVRMAGALRSGDILLLENLRFYKEEEKGDEGFAGKLARLGDVYVNDAFGTAHRAHASTAVIAGFFRDKVFGYVMGREIANIEKVMKDTRRPFTAILGGAKVSGKIQIIQNLMDKVDNLIIGGGMMFTFIKAMGGQVGSSLVEEDFIDLAKQTLEEAVRKNVKIFIPADAVIADAFDNAAKRRQVKAGQIPDGWMGLDIGEESIRQFDEVITGSATILWNGPMGVFEMPSFEAGTKQLALSVAAATAKGSFSLVGGGDSVAAIGKYGLEAKVSYVSTGGGAMLEYLEGKVLPGIAAIMD
ncbi:MAG TPA: phosphoglycerate kinase [Bacteroidales bacterium]|nr:phosphoglycerate kinase [Bacteroidales bacterium]HSA44492.1 phosphoglycerate kinase [Bacteroidales bacterium]